MMCCLCGDSGVYNTTTVTPKEEWTLIDACDCPRGREMSEVFEAFTNSMEEQ